MHATILKADLHISGERTRLACGRRWPAFANSRNSFDNAHHKSMSCQEKFVAASRRKSEPDWHCTRAARAPRIQKLLIDRRTIHRLM
jgi:hypothetical protein